MSEQESQPAAEERCPRCDSILPQSAERCLMCGLARPSEPADGSAAILVAVDESAARMAAFPENPTILEFPVRESRSQRLFWLVATLVVIGLAATWLALRDEGPRVMAAFIPTTTPLPPTVTNTPTLTPLPSPTLPPSPTPSPSSTPAPTSTPREPRFHTVGAGETLFGLSLLYRVSADSIAAANEFDLNAPIQSGQNLVIPWPTATPPLESVLLEINGEPVMADATSCEIITIQSGDSAYALSAIRGVPIEAIIAVNRQTQESISLLQPGDTLCIPRILYGDTIPPTAGPSPTPSLTPPPGGPVLLYPADGASFAADAGPIVVQWAAVKDLGADEWYMVEVRDLDDRDSLPHRGFTRDQSLRLPDEWRPSGEGQRHMQWRVSIVAVTGRRSDGGFIYTFRGATGAPSHFLWEGSG
jgi:LysM repeat protein